ncbi:MAG: Sua5/YciO/YrdC/YwlC family protein, partial [Anaerolineae bacterium]|nr:Sua5/YciO/YrdC/YwlC family protein [Anaerolineae bacterium]
MTRIRFAPILPADDPAALAEALRLLQAGAIVVFPTDTVYGVGAHGLREAAVSRLFDAKLRERDKAIPLLLSDASDVELVGVDIPALARELMARYWPGGLTLVVRARSGLPPSLTARGGTVAVRVPNHPTPRALAR